MTETEHTYRVTISFLVSITDLPTDDPNLKRVLTNGATDRIRATGGVQEEDVKSFELTDTRVCEVC